MSSFALLLVRKLDFVARGLKDDHNFQKGVGKFFQCGREGVP